MTPIVNICIYDQMKDEEEFLIRLPPPTAKQESLVTKCIMDLKQQVSADNEKYKLCEIAFLQLQKIVDEFAPSKHGIKLL